MKILITEALDKILQTELENEGYHCDYQPNITFKELTEICKNYDGLVIRSKFSLQADFFKVNKHLKFVGRLGAGMENIDVEFAEKSGIACINSPEGNRDAVGEHALGMLLALMNKMFRANLQIRNGIWQRNSNRGYEIQGKTVGIIGYGNMGSAFARRLCGFDARVIAYDKYKSGFSDDFVREVNLNTIFEQADILSLHVPLTAETHFMLNSEFISQFKKPFYLINTARGKIVKTSDLVNALKNGHIIAAGLDVLEYEKTDFENLYADNLPPDFEYLTKADNVILTPHIAGRTYESEEKLAYFLSQKIIKKFMKTS